MGNLNAKDSLKILDTVNYLESVDKTKASIWLLKYNDRITGDSRDALFKELDKGKHRGIFNQVIETKVDTTELSNTVKSPGGVMNTYAPVDRYKEAKAAFDNNLSNLNRYALGLQLKQEEYNELEASYKEDEERMSILVEDEYKDYPPALFTLGLGKKQAFSEVAVSNPDLYNSLKAKKAKMISIDAQLGFKKLGNIGQDSKHRQDAKLGGEKLPYLEYLEQKKILQSSLKTLNIFEGDSSKTVLPESFLMGQGYQTITLEEE